MKNKVEFKKESNKLLEAILHPFNACLIIISIWMLNDYTIFENEVWKRKIEDTKTRNGRKMSSIAFKY